LVLWLHGLLLLVMVPFGYHLVPQNAEIRTFTGQLFALGLVYYLALNPAVRSGHWSHSPRENAWLYALGALVAIVGLHLAVHVGGAYTSAALAWLGVVGLLGYSVLALLNLLMLPPAIWHFLGRRSASPTP
jgi:predicted membrane channel-forming protein YqfA (hemolysin III family)